MTNHVISSESLHLTKQQSWRTFCLAISRYGPWYSPSDVEDVPCQVTGALEHAVIDAKVLCGRHISSTLETAYGRIFE